MSVRITLELPDDVFSVLRSTPELFAAEMRLAAAVKWYELGKISQSKAAELAGTSRHEFLASLARFQVSPFQVSRLELESEVSGAQKLGR